MPCIAPPLAGGWCMRRRMTHACRLRLRSPSLTPPAIAPVRPQPLDNLKELCRETLRCLSRGRKIAQKHHQPQRLQLPVRRTPGSRPLKPSTMGGTSSTSAFTTASRRGYRRPLVARATRRSRRCVCSDCAGRWTAWFCLPGRWTFPGPEHCLSSGAVPGPNSLPSP